MYVCTRCKTEKAREEMGTDNSRPGGVDSWCRSCKVENETQRANHKRGILRHAKELFPCDDCGEYFPHYIMDWDHRNGDPSPLLRKTGWSLFPWAKILEELDKCDLVCANCHRTRTWARQQVAA